MHRAHIFGDGAEDPRRSPMYMWQFKSGRPMELRTTKQRAYVPTAGTLEPYAAPIMILVVEMAAVHHYTLGT